MRRITALPYDTLKLLNKVYKYSKKHLTRQKSHCILLSNKGYAIKDLSIIFDIHINTVYNWMNEWESRKILSLYQAKGQGRKAKITEEGLSLVKEMIERNPKQLNEIIDALEEKKSIKIHKSTLKRVLKKNS